MGCFCTNRHSNDIAVFGALAILTGALYSMCFIPSGWARRCPWATVHGRSCLGGSMRVSAFVDGFNLYHALDGAGQDYLKWIDLRRLCQVFAPTPDHELGSVYYFSAFATWRPEAHRRHKAFVLALAAVGVTTVMGKFKEKDRVCWNCRFRWKDHEEKETDVNIALHLLRDAYQDRFDRALLVSGDSDLAPAVRMVRELFPQKAVRIIAPYGRDHSMELVDAAGGVAEARRMRLIHLERSLLPAEIVGADGSVVTTRPAKYEPPARQSA